MTTNSSGSKRGAAKAGGLKVRVRTAKGRKLSSKLWLERQLNDPYVQAAKREGYRSRAAYKLAELDEKYKILKPGMTVVDLGAAPGGWTQIAVAKVGPKGKVVGIDLTPVEPIAGATLITQDFLAEEAPDQLKALLGGEANVVMSDMAAPATGHPQTDHMRIIGLCEAAAEFAREVLAPGGTFLAKVLRGGTEGTLLTQLKRDFAVVKHAKPPASRAGSAEIYVIATGFRGEN
ncbi:MAG TPA: RlmE family RNA methyltransferase [Alphaproteobacteria bacterium]|nr:RlmE family RNA methyltransferase [Alphaproteobacteria bacterium]